MGWLDITIGEEDQTSLIGAGAGFLIGGPAGAAIGYAAAQQVNKNNREQTKAIKEEQKAIEQARYDSLLRQVSSEIQADQSMLATLDTGSNNKDKPSVNTQQNKEVGSATSGTF